MSVLLRRTLACGRHQQLGTAAGSGSSSSMATANTKTPTLALRYLTSTTATNGSTHKAFSTFHTHLHRPTVASTAALCQVAPVSPFAQPNTSDLYPYTLNRIQPSMGLAAVRHFHLTPGRREQASSKVEETVKAIQTSGNGVAKPPPPKKSIGARVWAEVLHYYHGFRLLFIDMNVARKLVWKTLRGNPLTRREYMLLIRTTGDVFRLVPFSVFIIVPFMEFLLPVFIKFFPGMLPSTFETAKAMEDKARQSLKVKLEMAKFLQKTLDEMDVHNRNHSSEEAREFTEFFTKMRTSGERAKPEDIMRFSKLFEDEITLDSLSRQQLAAICRVLDVATIGTSAVMRFQLRMKVRSLAADDRMIQKEGVETLTLGELQAASRARGMRSYGLSLAQLRNQVSEWIHLSLNEKVPPSLLLLSRAMMLPEHVTTAEKLQASMTVLNESAAIQTKAAIGEREGKIDNKTKIEIIRDEQRKIKEELEEENVEKAKVAASEQLVDQAKVLTTATTSVAPAAAQLASAGATAAAATPAHAVPATAPGAGVTATASLTAKDIEAVSDAIGVIGAEKKTLMVEKEEIKDLKEEIAEYREDVEELNMISKTVSKPTIKESNASKNLLKKVDSMISKLDKGLAELEAKEAKLQANMGELDDKPSELVHIEEIINTIRKMQKVPDESKLEQIQKMLGRIDDDKDGHLKVDDVVRIVQEIGKESVALNEKQVDELMELINKEDELENEQKIEKALAKSLEESKRAAEELSDKATTVLVEKRAGETLSDAGTKVLDADKTDSKTGDKPPTKIDERINKSVIDSADQLAERQAARMPTSTTVTPSMSQPSAAAAANSSDHSGAANAKSSNKRL